MKHVKRIASLALAIVLVLALSVGAFAAGEGSITIDNAVVGQTYTIYEILYLESYNKDANAYAYKATTAWSNFVNGTDVKGVYLNVDDQGYVTWVDKADAAAFAKLAQKYAADNSIENKGTAKAESATVEFKNLELGYYLVDSTLGTLCSLDTTNPSVTIEEKNEAPTNEKKVEEDSTGALGSTNDADIGQRVKFVSTVTIPVGSENVVFHDKMSAGLTLPKDENGCILVYEDAALEKRVPDGNFDLKVSEITDGCTFEIDFTKAIGTYEKVYVVYYADVNENAKVGNEGNPNESWLSYGEEGKTTSTPSETKTYTWEIDVFKYTMDGENEKALKGAEFILYKDVKNTDDTTTRYYVTATAIDGGYRVTGWTTDKTAATKFVTPDTGKFAIKGLDSDTYYLEETTAPAGYNKLKDPVKVVIGENGTVTYGEKNTAANPDVKILNQTGAELPSTGGVGTTMFYVLGSVLVLGAAVVLITRRRMKRS